MPGKTCVRSSQPRFDDVQQNVSKCSLDASTCVEMVTNYECNEGDVAQLAHLSRHGSCTRVVTTDGKRELGLGRRWASR